MNHKLIKTIPVYSKNNQVFLKQESQNVKINNDEWYPINFQWIPIIKLQNNLKL